MQMTIRQNSGSLQLQICYKLPSSSTFLLYFLEEYITLVQILCT